MGGVGSSFSDVAETIKTCKETYNDEYRSNHDMFIHIRDQGNLEGSGGTSGDSEMDRNNEYSLEGRNGGKGGGVVQLMASKTCKLNRGHVKADGHWGLFESYDEVGSGGGSGGSISITT